MVISKECASFIFYDLLILNDTFQANILVSDDHQCCLADFGLAVAAESQSLGTTTTGVRGSVRWLAPELFGLDPVPDRENLTPRDVYAFGCTAYEVRNHDSLFTQGIAQSLATSRSCPVRSLSPVFLLTPKL